MVEQASARAPRAARADRIGLVVLGWHGLLVAGYLVLVRLLPEQGDPPRAGYLGRCLGPRAGASPDRLLTASRPPPDRLLTGGVMIASGSAEVAVTGWSGLPEGRCAERLAIMDGRTAGRPDGRMAAGEAWCGRGRATAGSCAASAPTHLHTTFTVRPPQAHRRPSMIAG